jgi:acyl-coenzyme A synthetase/AMP-(fatty) acid ligase
MSEVIDMLSALSALAAVVGWRDGEAIGKENFLASVRAWNLLFLGLDGEGFALYLDDSIEFAAALYGAWYAGKTIYLTADALPQTCALLRAKVSGFIGEFPVECRPHMRPAAAPGTAQEFAPLSPDFAGLVVHTSGSTGAPQAIPKKLSQMASEVRTLEFLFGPRLGKAEVAATVSHHHIYGLLFKVLWPLSAGRAIHARSHAYPEQLAADMKGRECALVASPAHLKRLPEADIWQEVRSGLRAVFSSGGPLPADALPAVSRAFGQAPIEVYGSSETGGVAWRQRQTADEAWTPLPGVAWRIAADDRSLEVHSPHLPDAAWMRLADRARYTDGDRFVLLGRADRIVKIEEKRISLDMIEALLAQSPLVEQARVIVIEGQRSRIAAFVVLSASGKDKLSVSGKLEMNQTLRDMLADSVERIALPRIWRYLDVLPVNAQGKTTHASLEALLDEGGPKAKPTMPRERLLEGGERRAVFELFAPADLLYFEGHFPEHPVLPGVVQIDWAIALGRRCFDLPENFLGIQVLKFQHVIRPETPVMLELVHDPVKSGLTFRYSSAAGQHSSGTILWGAQSV